MGNEKKVKRAQRYDRAFLYSGQDVAMEDKSPKVDLKEKKIHAYGEETEEVKETERNSEEPKERYTATENDAKEPRDRWFEDRMQKRLERFDNAQKDLKDGLAEVREGLQELSASVDHKNAETQQPKGPLSSFDALSDHELYQKIYHEVKRSGQAVAPGKAGVPAIGVKGFKSYFDSLRHRMEYATTVDTTAVPGVTRSIPGIIERPDDPRAILDFIPKIPWSNKSATVSKEDTDEFYARAETTVGTTVDGSGSAKTDIVLTSVKGLMEGTYFRVYGDDSAWHRLKCVSIATNTVTTVTDSIDFKASADNKVFFEYVGGVAEGETKLAGTYGSDNTEYTLYTTPVYVVASKQALWNKEELQNILQNRLVQRLENSLAAGVLYGPGSAPHPAGLMADSSRQTLAWSDLDETDDTRIDTILKAIYTKLKGNRSNVTVFVNSTDWYHMLKEKDSNGQYLNKTWGLVTLGMGNGSLNINGFRVEIDDTLFSGDCLVRKANASDIRYNPRSEGLVVGHIASQLISNEITFLREIHWTHVLKSPYSWVDVAFDSAPSS